MKLWLSSFFLSFLFSLVSVVELYVLVTGSGYSPAVHPGRTEKYMFTEQLND